jgi:hypothetical protein
VIWEVVGGVIVALIGAGSAVYVRRSTARAEAAVLAANAAKTRADEQLETNKQETENRRVDGEAYDRAQEINRGIVQDLTNMLDRVRQELASCAAELATAKAANVDLQATADRLTRANVNLLNLLEQCKRLLDEHRIPVPEGI